jgi:DNA-binding CsgD family transcriptional regulator
MHHCPVTGLPITERSQWSIDSPKGDYTKKFTLIGNDIIRVEKHARHGIILEHLDQASLSALVREEKISGKPLHLMIDCTNIADFSYSYKKDFTSVIYNWNPDFRVVVFYNISPGIRLQLEMFRSIAPQGLTFILSGNYAEAISAIMDFKSGKTPEETATGEARADLEPFIREEFLSSLARMAWLKMFDQQIYLPPETHASYPFFKALEAIQGDFKAIEIEHETLLERTLEDCRRQLAQKTTALNAQIELNRKNVQQFREEKFSLASRLSSNDLESTRISTANAEKTSALKTLCELIANLEIDPGIKQKISTCCLNLVETGQKEAQLNTDLTEADSTFISMLQKRHPNLNQRELRICLLIKLDYSSRDISRLMGLSVRGIESTRYRIHRKIGIDKHRSLKTYLTNLPITVY